LHTELFTFDESMLDPPLAHALATGDGAALRVLFEEVTQGVFVAKVLSGRFCAQMVEELEAMEAEDVPMRRPNSMNRYGAVLNDFGFHDMLDGMLPTVCAPPPRPNDPRASISW
jgi:hypothetical protein